MKKLLLALTLMGSLMSVRAQVIRGTETSTADGRRLIATNIFGMQQMLGVLAGQTVFNGDGSGLTNNWGSYSLLPYSYSLVSSNQAAQIAQLFAGSSSSSAFSSISVTGAVGNGIANDWGAFSNAIYRANTTANTSIVVPPGTYFIGTNLPWITNGNVEIYGQGNATLMVTNPGVHLFQVYGMKNKIHDLFLGGPSTNFNTTAPASIAIQTYPADLNPNGYPTTPWTGDLQIYNCVFTNWDTAIALTNTTQAHIYHDWFLDFAWFGVQKMQDDNTIIEQSFFGACSTNANTSYAEFGPTFTCVGNKFSQTNSIAVWAQDVGNQSGIALNFNQVGQVGQAFYINGDNYVIGYNNIESLYGLTTNWGVINLIQSAGTVAWSQGNFVFGVQNKASGWIQYSNCIMNQQYVYGQPQSPAAGDAGITNGISITAPATSAKYPNCDTAAMTCVLHTANNTDTGTYIQLNSFINPNNNCIFYNTESHLGEQYFIGNNQGSPGVNTANVNKNFNMASFAYNGAYTWDIFSAISQSGFDNIYFGFDLGGKPSPTSYHFYAAATQNSAGSDVFDISPTAVTVVPNTAFSGTITGNGVGVSNVPSTNTTSRAQYPTNAAAGVIIDATTVYSLFITNAGYAPTGFSGLASGYQYVFSQTVSNSLASAIVASNPPSCHMVGSITTNGLSIPSGQEAVFSYWIWPNLRTNVCNVLVP